MCRGGGAGGEGAGLGRGEALQPKLRWNKSPLHLWPPRHTGGDREKSDLQKSNPACALVKKASGPGKRDLKGSGWVSL